MNQKSGRQGGRARGLALGVAVFLLAGGISGAAPPGDVSAGCPGATLQTAEECTWWVQEVTAGATPGPVLLLGCVQPQGCESQDDGGDDDDAGGTPAGGASSGETPASGGEDVESVGRFRFLTAWDPALADALACAAPVLAELPGGVLVCWDQAAGTLCGRAFRITAWAGDLPAAGELSAPVCVSFTEPEDRAQAEADLLARFTGDEDD